VTLRLRTQQVAALAQDFAGRTLAEAFALRHVTVERHADPRFLGLRDPAGSVGLLELDEHARIASHRHPSGRQLSMQYSESHRLTGIQLPSGLQTVLEYDGQDRLSRLDRDGLEWQLHYTDTARVAAVTYPDQTCEIFENSDSGQLVGYIDRRSNATRFVWEDGRLKQIIDANGHATTFRYGAWERPDSLARPDGTIEEVVRDWAGLPKEVRVDGVSVAHPQFDGERLTAIRYADGEALSFAYDDQGRLTEGSTGNLKVTRAYSDEGRLVRECIGDQAVDATYAFDGQLESITTDGGQVRFRYDGDRRLLRIEDWQGGQQHYRYDNTDRDVVRTVPGLEETSRLTPMGLVAQVMTYATPGGELRAWRQVAHDVNDRVVSANDSHFGQTDYQYDPDGQLLAAVNADSAEYFAYDPNGNRVACNGMPATFDSVNALRTLGAERLLYDKRGNLVKRESPSGITSYAFNARNLLAKVTRADGVCIEFSYDAFGRRIAKRVGDAVTRYMWFGNHMIYEWCEGEVASRIDYLYKPGTHEPLAMRQGTAIYYFHNGHDGAPRRLSDRLGRFVWAANYNTFGELLRSEGVVYQPLRFAGQFADAETGLYYNQARYYAPGLGRYTSRDPLEFVSGPNAYLYCNNDPIGGRDPTGLLGGFWKAVVAATIVTVGIVAIVAAAPAILAAAGAVAAGTAIAAGTASTIGIGFIGGAFLVGAGVGLGLAPDGCAKCQARMFFAGGFAMAGMALSIASMIIFPPLAGGGGAMLALAGGGTLATGSAMGVAGAAAGVAGILGANILQMGAKDDGGANSDETSDDAESEGPFEQDESGKIKGDLQDMGPIAEEELPAAERQLQESIAQRTREQSRYPRGSRNGDRIDRINDREHRVHQNSSLVALDAALRSADSSDLMARSNLMDGVLCYPRNLNIDQAQIVLKLANDSEELVRHKVVVFLGAARRETIESAIERFDEPRRSGYQRGLLMFDADPSQAQAIFDRALTETSVASTFALASIERMAREQRLCEAPKYGGDGYLGECVLADVERLLRRGHVRR